MKLTHSIYFFLLTTMLGSCTHPGSPNQPTDTTIHKDTTSHPDTSQHVVLFDTLHFRTALITIHGVIGTFHNHSKWSSASGTETNITDTTINASLDENLEDSSSTEKSFYQNIISLQQNTYSYQALLTQTATVVVDSARSHFLQIEYVSSYNSGTSLDFSGWEDSLSFASMPFTIMPDGSLLVHVSGCALRSYSFSSTSFVAESSTTESSSLLIGIDSVSNDAYTEIVLKP